MALVKFGQQTFSIDGVPDGHVIVPEGELSRTSKIADSYAMLKKNIPVDIREEEIASFIDRGRRYDDTMKSFEESKKQLEATKGELGKLSNIPKDFSKERWDKFVQQEQDELFQTKIDALTKKVSEKVEKEFGVKATIDPRFINPEKLQSFNPDDEKAFDNWYAIMDEAHSAQESFLKDHFNVDSAPSAKPIVAADQRIAMPTIPNLGGKHPKDSVGDQGVVVGGFNRPQ